MQEGQTAGTICFDSVATATPVARLDDYVQGARARRQTRGCIAGEYRGTENLGQGVGVTVALAAEHRKTFGSRPLPRATSHGPQYKRRKGHAGIQIAGCSDIEIEVPGGAFGEIGHVLSASQHHGCETVRCLD